MTATERKRIDSENRQIAARLSRQLPIFLYHTTTAPLAKIIFAEGLKPRAITGFSTWKNLSVLGMESDPDFVYLARDKCLFAHRADELVLIEINTSFLNFQRLCPDEDFVVNYFCGRNGGGKPNSADYLKAKNILTRHKWMWSLSLDILGSVAYQGTIPHKAIKQIDPDGAA